MQMVLLCFYCGSNCETLAVIENFRSGMDPIPARGPDTGTAVLPGYGFNWSYCEVASGLFVLNVL